jgi:hypothetical protein
VDGKQTLYSVDVPAETDIDAVLSIVEDGQDNKCGFFKLAI